MIILPLSTLIEESNAILGIKNFTGNVMSYESLFNEDNIKKLEEYHQGVFAFLAFHPTRDEAVVDYIKQETLTSDSGPTILVMFICHDNRKFARKISKTDLEGWIEIDQELHPSYEVIRKIFLPNQVPPIPGIVFFERLSAISKPVYVTLGDCKEGSEVGLRLGKVFSFADAVYRNDNRDDFPITFSEALLKEKIEYFRPGPLSVAEWLIQTYRNVMHYKSEIMTAIGFAV